VSHEAPAPPAASAARSGQHPYALLAIVLTATFMQLVDISIVNTAIPSIQRNLGASYAAIQLVLVLYQLAFACVLITAARLGDIVGRKRMFMIGMAGFTIASALCGAAQSPNMLVVARFVQGLMSGLMFPQVLSMIQVTFPPRERGKAFGIYGATIGVATILGPLLGGLLIQLDLFGTEWRMIFFVNVPIGIVSFIAAARRLGENRAPEAARLDVPGAVLATAALFLVVYPLTEGREKGWPLWLDAMLVAALPLLVVFGWYERRRTEENRSPLVFTSLFGIHAFRVGLGLSMVFFAGLPAFFFTFSVYLQIGEGFSALGAGLTAFTFAIGSATASARSDAIASRLGNQVLAVGLGLLLVGACGILLTVRVVGIHPHIWAFAPSFLVAGAGLGLFVAPLTNIILAGVPGRSAGPASGVLSTAQQVGGAMGVALIGIIFFGVLGTNAPAAADDVTPGLRTSLATAGMPPAAVAQAVAGFRQCLDDRSHAKDPTAVPPSCRVPDNAPRAVVAAFAAAGREARGKDFSRSFQQAMLYELAVFALSLVLVRRLPRADPQRLHAPAAAAEA
jgi:EmrB/QacA subfamily drug resistance transporter